MDADLIEAFHAIYDVKDAHLDEDDIRVAAYNALRELELLMHLTGYEVPDRYDGTGR